MTQEATEDLFDIHQKYVNSIQRLSLSPQIVNIDRIREEVSISGKTMQSTRDWANGVKTEEGKKLQCDAENGGKDRKAYLLVPAPLIPMVQPILQKYLSSIRNNTQFQSNRTGETNDKPNEIYIPTASVQRNVDFLRNMSSSDIWKNAPSTIRIDQTQRVPNQTTKPASNSREAFANTDQEQIRTPTRQGHSPTQDIRNTSNTTTTNNNYTYTQQNRTIDDNTIETYTSTASTTLNSSYHATRFAELEAAVKANQSNFNSMSNQYQEMENKILETMSSCHENTKQLLSMQGQMNNLQITMQTIADQMKIITTHLTIPTNNSAEITLPRSPVKKKQRQSADTERTNDNPNCTQSEDAQSTIDDSRILTLPADQDEAQYTTNSFPASAMQE